MATFALCAAAMKADTQLSFLSYQLKVEEKISLDQ
jgi:hypothetical protein